MTDGPADVRVTAHAPGRVNLIGEHTDYTGGLALPMAIDLGTRVTGVRRAASHEIRLRSADANEEAVVPTHVTDPASTEPAWARYVAGVVHELQPVAPIAGFDGEVTTTVPLGSGLSSSAALELAVALALGFEGSAHELASLGQRAEQVASGVPCGIMDQLASAAGVAGHALLMNFTTLAVEPVPVPEGASIHVIHSGQHRELAGSAYGERRDACERAAAQIGPLLDADVTDLRAIDDETVRRRARHVITENERVRSFAAAFRAGDLATAGEIMTASHHSLRDDFSVSIDVLDALVARLERIPGVHGARLTGAGFGGCVVALAEPGALDEGWHVQASGGADVEILD
jgi:galactokinase